MPVQMDALSKKHGRCFVLHAVAKGENLSKIAAKYKTSVKLIDKYNAIVTDTSHIEIGWKLEVPDERPGKQKFTAHTVAAGESLGKIAKVYLTTVEAIVDCNPEITNPNLIRPGATYRVPDNR